jgi:hypothetical protein
MYLLLRMVLRAFFRHGDVIQQLLGVTDPFYSFSGIRLAIEGVNPIYYDAIKVISLSLSCYLR